MRFKVLIFLSVAFNSIDVVAQSPVINSVQPSSSAPTQKIELTGSGFNSTSSQLSVWFDHVKGIVTSSSNFSIQVQVPPQARFSNIEVINLSNNLSGKSSQKFMPSFGGATFDETKISTPYTNTDGTELFDIASGDLDLDGKPDLLVSKTNNGNPATDLLIYKNSSTGIGNVNFSKVDKSVLPVLNIGAPTSIVSCGDLNGDGKPDIIASRTGGTRNQIYILRNTNSTVGTLSFASAPSLFIDASQFAFNLSVRDLNGDGKPEIVVSNSFDDLNPATDNIIYVFPNQSTSSTISFAAPIRLTVTGASTTYGLDVQDLDGDGLPDIVLNQFQASDIFIFRNVSTGNISFAPVQKISATGSFNSITTADLNNDGMLDLIATATLDNTVQFWINNSSVGNISFGAPQVLATSFDASLPSPTNGGPWGIDVSDIDGDGDADLVVANRYYAKLNVFRQDGSLSFTKLEIGTSKPCRNLRAGDYDGDGKPEIAVTSFLGTQFSVDVIRNANCVSPVITGPSNTICVGQTIRLQTKPALGVTFDWKKDGISVQTSALEYFDATASGTYTVTATGTFDTGCSIISPNFVLASGTGSAPANPSISNNMACIGGTLNLSTTAVSGATYLWTGPNNFTSSLQAPSITPVASSTAGVYSLKVTVNGCSSSVVSQQVDVAFVPVLPVTATPSSTSCVGSNVTLSVGSGYTYQWNKGGVAIGGQTSSTLSLTSLTSSNEGDYSVVVTDGSTTCSQETAKTSVKVFALPIVDFTFSSPLCSGSAVNFTSQATGDSRGSLSYLWAFGDGNNATTLNAANTYVNANSYGPSLTVGYVGITGCTTTASKSLTINSSVIPSIQSSANPICAGDNTTLSISGTFNSIAWGGDNSLTGTLSSVTISKSGTYSVTTKDANGCPGNSTITINPKPTITPFAVTIDKTTPIKSGDHAQLTATAGADTYAWTPASTLSDATINNPIATPITNTTYKVIAKKAGFCDAIDSLKVLVDNGGGANISPPVLFSPNGDAKNDFWIITDTDNYPDCTMTIYDSHGSQVYQQKGYNTTNYWDGSFNGKQVPDGTYFYVFSCPDLKPVTGTVLVVR